MTARTRSPVTRAALALGALAAIAGAAPLAAQYPLAPSPVFNAGPLKPTPKVDGYLSLRETLRHDTSTADLNRGRITLAARPASFAALHLQGEYSSSASGRLRGDSSVAGFALTDAYVQLQPQTPGHAWQGVRPTLIVGQFKQPFSLEYVTPFTVLLTADRAEAVTKLSPKRDIGAMGQLRWSRFVILDGSITNGEGPNKPSNTNGLELGIGRLTVMPVRGLALAAKVADQGPDQMHGFDGRWIWRRLIVEGEQLRRTHPLAGGGGFDASGGYVLAAVRLLPWLQPVYKWERYDETDTRLAGTTTVRSIANTFGVNVATPTQKIRLQLDWVDRTNRPVAGSNHAFVAQFFAIF